ncbi:LysM peptidoglycan-binding domain-containing protein [Oceanospirillum sediminis]|uniref:M23 family metallopeptidase n=1 Tax=Oceanospirillum sediminis TaxID=2760088 RepID=A0A839IM29_9GAMM|nr:M23 family metallopeptidase [Oceanospirillum sediminis]MBB1486285.1 M23 family metallopeptidase [Oceanospirillum sediminis]
MLKRLPSAFILCFVLLLGACSTTPASPPSVSDRHVVQRGETFYGIARKYGVSVPLLARYNPRVVPHRLQAGTELSIPVNKKEVAADRVPYTVQKGDTLSKLANHFAVSLSALKVSNPGIDYNRLKPGQKIWIPVRERTVTGFNWPLQNPRIFNGFGKKDWGLQKGVNLAAKKGQSVLASKGGTVSFAGEMRSLGKVVIIEHADEQQTVYASCETLKVKAGDKVQQRQIIGTVGFNTLINRYALHFQFRDRGTPLPPENYLPEI